MKRFPVALWLGGLLMLLVEGNSSWTDNDGGSSFSALSEEGFSALDAVQQYFSALEVGMGLVAFIGATIVFSLIQAFIRVGFIRHCARMLDSEHGEYAVLFSGASAMLSMFGVIMIRNVILAAIGIVAVAIPMYFAIDSESAVVAAVLVPLVIIAVVAIVYIYIGTMLADYAVALDDARPIDALRHSWDLCRGHRLWLIWFELVLGFVQFVAALVGLLMFCIGAIATIPAARGLSGVAHTESYLLLTRTEATWSVR